MVHGVLDSFRCDDVAQKSLGSSLITRQSKLLMPSRIGGMQMPNNACLLERQGQLMNAERFEMNPKNDYDEKLSCT